MTLPARMTVIAIRAPGGPEMLVPEERPVPAPGPGEILVKVAAAGVNRPDVRQRQGTYPPPKGATDIPGLEIAGEVAALGDGVKRWKLGDKVCALVVGGGYAQYCLALRAARAAGAAVAFDDRGRGHPGDVLHLLAEHVHARATSRAATGCWCMAARRASAPPRSCWPRRSAPRSSPPRARRKNARRPASSAPTSRSTTRPKTSSPMTKEATGGKGANLIVDMVGGDYIDRNYDCAAEQGVIVQVSFTGGPKATVEFRQAHAQAPAPTPARRCARAPSPRRPRSRAASRRRSGRWSRPARSSR